MYGAPPYAFEGNRTISMSFTTSPDVLRELVPEPLVPNGDNLMSLVINRLRVVQPGEFSYNEALLSIPVSYGESTGHYSPVLYLDKALGIVSGREIWGYSKIDADIDIVENEDSLTAQVTREGTTLIDVTFELGPVALPITTLPDARYFNLKAIPSAASGTPYDVKQITSSVIRDYEIQKLTPGKGQITFGTSPTDPLGNIPVISIQDANFLVYNSVLDYDGILYDYLEEGK
jgi:acetoacetate decarboxylase